jgi:hypothetical protein
VASLLPRKIHRRCLYKVGAGSIGINATTRVCKPVPARVCLDKLVAGEEEADVELGTRPRLCSGQCCPSQAELSSMQEGKLRDNWRLRGAHRRPTDQSSLGYPQAGGLATPTLE